MLHALLALCRISIPRVSVGSAGSSTASIQGRSQSRLEDVQGKLMSLSMPEELCKQAMPVTDKAVIMHLFCLRVAEDFALQVSGQAADP